MSHECLIKVSSAPSAAVFFGNDVGKSSSYEAFIYEKDGKPYTKKCFWMKRQTKMEDPSKERLAQIAIALPFCEFADEGIDILDSVPKMILS